MPSISSNSQSNLNMFTSLWRYHNFILIKGIWTLFKWNLHVYLKTKHFKTNPITPFLLHFEFLLSFLFDNGHRLIPITFAPIRIFIYLPCLLHHLLCRLHEHLFAHIFSHLIKQIFRYTLFLMNINLSLFSFFLQNKNNVVGTKIIIIHTVNWNIVYHINFHFN